MEQLYKMLHGFFAPLGINEQWYVFIFVGGVLLVLLLLYILLVFVRAFFCWIGGINDMVSRQQDTNNLLLEILQMLEKKNEISEDVLEQLILIEKRLMKKSTPPQKSIPPEEKSLPASSRRQHKTSRKKI